MPQTVLQTVRSSTSLSAVELSNAHGSITKPKRYHWYASRYLCCITIAVILLLSVGHVLRRRLLPIYRARCQAAEKRNPRHTSTVEYVCWTILSTMNRAYRWCILTTLPEWLLGPDTVADAVCSALYCGLLCFFAVNKSKWVGGNQNVANQMGVMAFSQLPLILVLVMKNNPISLLTGITYQKFNYLHRAASRACLLCSWIHVVLWTPRVWARGHFSHPYIISGLVALFGYTMLWATSLRIVRRVAWEFFIVAHILFTLMFLVAAVFHWAKLSYWVWPALAFWFGDRLLRVVTLTRLNSSQTWATIEMLESSTLRLTIECDELRWKAGQHAFLSFPGLHGSSHESHPFSFANTPFGTHNQAIFLIKVHFGVTRRLYDSLGSPATHRIPIRIDGPYGSVHDISHASSVLLLAGMFNMVLVLIALGGTGVTFCLSHLVALVSTVSLHTPSQPRNIRLLWHIREAQDVNWILPILEQVSHLFAELRMVGTSVQIDFFVTRVGASHQENNFTGSFNCRLPPAVEAVTRWNHGRADLFGAVAELWSNSTASSAIVVCGPYSLIRATRLAAKRVPRLPYHSTLDIYSETLGS